MNLSAGETEAISLATKKKAMFALSVEKNNQIF
jgi:hypothetical protein